MANRYFKVMGALNYETGWMCDGDECDRDDGFCLGHLSGGKTLTVDVIVAGINKADAQRQALQRARGQIEAGFDKSEFIEWDEWDDDPDIVELSEAQHLRIFGYATLPTF